MLLFLLLIMVLPTFPHVPVAHAAANISIQSITAYNFIVDSNVLTPATYAPHAATVGAKFCNTGDMPATNVTLNIGQYYQNTNAGDPLVTLAAPIAGQYPQRSGFAVAGTPDKTIAAGQATSFNTAHPDLSGTGPYSFTHVGGSMGTGDATRTYASIAVGECVTEYWLITYPNKSTPLGNETVAGDIKPNDDLYLYYDLWATSSAPTVSATRNKATMRNEISASANKIWPNGTNKVPSQYLDAIAAAFGWATLTPGGGNTAYPGETLTTQGIWYDLGNVGAGFDNDGNFVPDHNAWMQPVGDPSTFDPGCFRLVRTYGLVIVKLVGGGEYLIPFVDQLYFENIPDNTGAVGLVYYEYAALNGECTAALSPYQEVASGFDNEKFNGDFGYSIPPLQSAEPVVPLTKVALDTNGDPILSIAPGGTIRYELQFENNTPLSSGLTVNVGDPSLGLPLRLEDEIPPETTYVPGSATTTIDSGNLPGITVTIYYRDDSGATSVWTTAEPADPADVGAIRWEVNEPLPPVTGSNNGYIRGRFDVTVDDPATLPSVDNTGKIRLGGGPPLDEESTTTPIGVNTIGDLVWLETDRDGVNEVGEAGMPNITINLYQDTNGNGILETGEPLYRTTETDTNGAYLFLGVPDGDWIVSVDLTDTDLNGNGPTSPPIKASTDLGVGFPTQVNDLDNDFGFGPPLALDKTGPTASVEVNDLVTYQIELSNLLGTGGGPYVTTCSTTVDVWGSTRIDNDPANNKDFLPTGNIFDVDGPDGVTASGVFGNVTEQIGASTFSTSIPSGTITSLSALIDYSIPALNNDGATLIIYRDGTLTGTSYSGTAAETLPLTAAQLDNGSTFDGTLVVTLATTGWQVADFQGNLTGNTSAIRFITAPNPPGDNVTINMDALGFRVGIDYPCSNLSGDQTTVASISLTDTYDTSRFEFVSANPLPVSHNPTTGVITWENLGPITSANSEAVLVTMRALATGTDIVNTASVVSATYPNGRTTNIPPDDTALTTIIADTDARISGRVWRDTGTFAGWNTNASFDELGYDAGDTFVGGVPISLYVCIANATGQPRSTFESQDCDQAGADDGYWELVGTDITDSNGNYSFENLADGFYLVVANGTIDSATGVETVANIYGSTRVAEVGQTDTDQSPWTGTGDNGNDCPCNGVWGNGDGTTLNGNFELVNGTDNITNINFGLSNVNSNWVYGRVWNDADGTGGLFGANDSAISGATVWLDINDDGFVDIGETTPTDAYGYYRFTGLAAGTYDIQVNAIPGTGSWTETSEYTNTTPLSIDNQITVTVGTNQVSGSHDFGFYRASRIGNTVYFDLNGNGDQDGGEPGISDVTVHLYNDVNGDNTIDVEDTIRETVVTDSNGEYLFTRVPAGSYIVVVDSTPFGTTQTGDPDEAGGVCGTCDNRSIVDALGVVDGISDYLAEDFGYDPTGNSDIGDVLYIDNNFNGSFDVGDTGISNVTVYLYQDVDADGVIDAGTDTVVRTTTTDSNGNYLFPYLPAGSYIIVPDESDPDFPDETDDGIDVIPTGDPDEQPGVCITCDGQGTSTVNGTTDDLTQDFGYRKAVGLIGDHLFWDANLNGTEDYTEVDSGVSGVTVSLYVDYDPAGPALPDGYYDATDAANQPGGYPLTDVTDANGNYLFTDLPDGYYVVVVTTGNNQTADPSANGIYCDVGLPESDDLPDYPDDLPLVAHPLDECNNQHGVRILNSNIYLAADFGYAPTNVIGDTVFYDADRDGVQDWLDFANPSTREYNEPFTEPGIADVTVRLYNDADNSNSFSAGDTVAQTTTTDSNGNYTFMNVTNGEYVVVVDTTTGGLSSYGQTGDPDEAGVCSTCNSQSPVTVLNSSHMDRDFGYRLTGAFSLSGSVCTDIVNNGFCTAADQLHVGIPVYLYKLNAVTSAYELVGQTTTVAGGVYTFSNLPNGDYITSMSTNVLPVDRPSLTTQNDDVPGDVFTFTSIDPTSGDTVLTAAHQTVTINNPPGNIVSGLDFAYISTVVLDFGDLPDTSYQTSQLTLQPNAPRHIITNAASGLRLGSLPTSTELVPRAPQNGSGDGADDGVSLVTSGGEWELVFNTSDNRWYGSIRVTVSNGSGWLVGWMDFPENNTDTIGNLSFYDAGEMVVNQAVASNTGVGDGDPNSELYTFTFPVPDSIVDRAGITLNARFRLFESEPGLSVFAFTGLASNGEVEDYSFGDGSLTTTPVTLSYFLATRTGNATHFDWSTDLEAGNAGFNLYVENANDLTKINDDLIPAKVTDAMERTDYKYTATGIEGDTFYIEDVDVLGTAVMHGPYKLDEVIGERIDGEPINWAEINNEHNAKESQRQADAIRDAKERSARAQAALTSNPNIDPATLGYPVFNLSVNKTGLHRVTYEQLLAMGLDLKGVHSKNLTVTNRGVNLPIVVEPNGLIGSGSYILFYGEAIDTLYTDTNVYQLRIDPRNAVRASSDNVLPKKTDALSPFYMETVVLERNRLYGNTSPLSDPWYDTELRTARAVPASWNFTLNLSNYAPNAAPGTLVVDLYGLTDHPSFNPDHHIKVLLNGTVVADERWNGMGAHPLTIQIPNGVLREGANTLTFTAPADLGLLEITRFDGASITYPRTFQAKNGSLTFMGLAPAFKVEGLTSANVTVLRYNSDGTAAVVKAEVKSYGTGYAATFGGSTSEAKYVVYSTSAMLTPGLSPQRVQDITSGSAEFVLISHPNFLDGLAPLVAARQSQGMTVRLVDVRDVYDQFGYGVFDAQAIKDYVAFANANMGTRYILLVGGDTYDYRHYLTANAVSFMPSLYHTTDALIQFAPVDPLYADVNNDLVPDLAIGRFPVRTNAELATVVKKTLDYGNKTYSNTSMFVADTSFTTTSNMSLGLLARNFAKQRVYLDQMSVTNARSALIAAINKGTALTVFTGHSSLDRWTLGSLFTTANIPQLNNAGKPTVVIQWGCWNTYYVRPDNLSMGTQLMTSGDRGAVVVMGAVGLTTAYSESELAAQLMPLIGQQGMTVGDALLFAKQQYAEDAPSAYDVLLGWTILGDPTVVVSP